ncbi:methionine aminotransferase [Flavobacterium sp. 14A]|uniref:methionine aminotransferase n=1 Tax=Flavobacterium sp. 14A TaxID=2735896 RepID=UPI0015705E78|nr:methionine aminotransferase [Flavobacterium sp. 14A]NRT11360.1 methionine aminotransferase [Flavobacterium sp. 14A]
MSKLPNVKTSIFSIMSKMAAEYNAINLSQGFPNFPVDKKLTTIVEKLASENVHQYVPMAGYPPLLDKIAHLTKNSYNRSVSSDIEILVTAGATQGIFTAIQALVNSNEEVIILDPSYDCYEAPILLCNAKPVRIPLNDDYTVNWQTVKEACSNKTRMIIINNPHNPTGKTLNQADFASLIKIMDAFPDIILLSDEVYEYITFEEKHLSAHLQPTLANRAIVVSSFGKSLHITGWKIGYLIAPEHLMIEIKKVHQYLVFSVNSICQVAISQYLDVVSIENIRESYQQKRDLFRSLLKSSRFELLPCEGTYFQVASYTKISNENDVDFCKRLITEHGVAAIPISSFYENGTDLKLIRFCFAKDDETLRTAAIKLCQV